MARALYDLKPWYTRRLAGVIGLAVKKDVSPDVFTAVGVLGAAIGGAGFLNPYGPGWVDVLIVLIGGLVVRLGGANLDGAVARARGVSRPFGFVLNELGDRISDYLLFFGLYLAAPAVLAPWVVAVAFVSSIPTLVSVSGAAVGVPRINGSFGKTERSVLFVIAAAVITQTVALAILLAVLAVLAGVTVTTRSAKIRAHLAQHDTGWVDDQPTVVEGR